MHPMPAPAPPRRPHAQSDVTAVPARRRSPRCWRPREAGARPKPSAAARRCSPGTRRTTTRRATSQDLGLIVNLGWRWRCDGADCIDDFLAKGKIDFSWAVEPLVGGVFGDAEAFEASVVPYAQLRALSAGRASCRGSKAASASPTPGFATTASARGCEFSDNVGVGVTFGSGEGRRWSIGYRFRHLSHAGHLRRPQRRTERALPDVHGRVEG